MYGADVHRLNILQQEHPSYTEPLIPGWPYRKAEVIWAVRQEMARTVEDVLARRLRVLFLDARLARQMAPEVAALMQVELGKSASWARQQIEAFQHLSALYLLSDNDEERQSYH